MGAWAKGPCAQAHLAGLGAGGRGSRLRRGSGHGIVRVLRLLRCRRVLAILAVALRLLLLYRRLVSALGRKRAVGRLAGGALRGVQVVGGRGLAAGCRLVG